MEAKKEKGKQNERGSWFSRDQTNPFRDKWEDIAAFLSVSDSKPLNPFVKINSVAEKLFPIATFR